MERESRPDVCFVVRLIRIEETSSRNRIPRASVLESTWTIVCLSTFEMGVVQEINTSAHGLRVPTLRHVSVCPCCVCVRFSAFKNRTQMYKFLLPTISRIQRGGKKETKIRNSAESRFKICVRDRTFSEIPPDVTETTGGEFL